MESRKLPGNVGSNAARTALARLAHPEVNAAALPDAGEPGQACLTRDGALWIYDETSVVTADDVLVAGAATAGRWLRAPNQVVELVLPITFATADAATLYTVPVGAALKLLAAWWEVTTAWTGGASSAIGIDSDATGLSTAGDILGGGTGDVEAGLTEGEFRGTVGAVDLAIAPLAGLSAGELIRFQRITSAFTAGAGNVHILASITKNAGV